MSIYYRRFFCFHFKNHLLHLVYNSIPCWNIWVLQFFFLVHRYCFWGLQALHKHTWFVQNCSFIRCIVYSTAWQGLVFWSRAAPTQLSSCSNLVSPAVPSVVSPAVPSVVLLLEVQAEVLKTQVLIKFVVIWGSTLNSQNQ